jgi:hypothetical protein
VICGKVSRGHALIDKTRVRKYCSQPCRNQHPRGSG